VRAALALAFSVLTVTAAGCGSDVRQLNAEVTNATPATGRSAGKCAGEEALIESAWTKCILVVHGTRRVVIRDVARRLRKEGFRMGCEDSLGALELVAVRGQVRVIADVRPGAITFDPSDGNKPLDVVDAKFAPPGSRKIPAGSVGLKVSADKLETSAGSYPLPRGSCP
jgi:hypothetical protein